MTYAGPAGLEYLATEDRYVGPDVIERKVARREILVLRQGGRTSGCLRYGHLWDEIPFMNLLWVQEGQRGEGLGTRLVSFWEEEMRKFGHEMVMTSSLSDERAQHLYRRLGSTRTAAPCSCRANR